ncbi:hypothetical protein SAMN02787142_0701 [Burkholderia sp. WP9]|nr:hypothetical protein [Burkholderia sp. WP9]SEC00191.1 hypothetical protein SAMN02787142_0701 [Burkholderia sp. WP9]
MLQIVIENRDLLIVLGFCTLMFGLLFPETFGNGNAEFYKQLERESR